MCMPLKIQIQLAIADETKYKIRSSIQYIELGT